VGRNWVNNEIGPIIPNLTIVREERAFGAELVTFGLKSEGAEIGQDICYRVN
jgi:hypothetical protein